MDAVEQAANWGDPYIGLRVAADRVLDYTQIVSNTPRLAQAGMYASLGSPGVFEDIAWFLGTLIWYLNPVNAWGVLYQTVINPALTWLRHDLWTGIASFLVSQVQLIMSWLYNTINPIREAIKGAIDGVRAAMTNVYNWLRDTAGSIGHAVKDAVLAIRVWLTNNLNSLLTTIRDALTGAYAWLRTTLGSTLAAIQHALSSAQAWLSTTFSGLIAGVRDALSGAYTWLRQTLAGLLAGLKESLVGVYTWLRETAGGAIAGLSRTIWEGLTNWWATIIGWVRDGWQALVAAVAGGVDWVISTVGPTVRKWVDGFVSIPGAYLDFVATTAGTNLALQPGRALATAGALYTMAIVAGTGAHVMSTALNALPEFNWVGASQLSAYVAQAAGFAPLTNATYGVLLNECLAWPIRYYYNAQLRPRMPTIGEIYTMGRKRGLTYGEFAEAMAYQGLPDWWIERIYDFFWTDPSPYWLLRMSETANPELKPSAPVAKWLDQWLPDWRNDPWAWYRAKLMLAGYEDTDLQAFIDGFQRRLVGPAVTRVKTVVRAMVREAYWDRGDVEACLRPLGVRQDEIEYLILAEEIDYQNRYCDLEVQRLLEAFRKGELSRQDLSLALSAVVVKPERVAQLVAREETRLLPKPKAVVPLKEDPKVRSLVTQAVNSWTKAFRDWRIDLDLLEVGLTVVLQDPALAHEMRNVEATRYRPEPPVPKPPLVDPVVAASRRASIASWIKQFRDGEISAEMLEVGLSPLIDDPGRLKEIVQLERLRAPTPAEIIPPYEEDPELAKLRQEYVRGHLEMFRKRLIGLEELYVYLLADGLAEPLARATALTQALKRVSVPPLESPYFQQDRLRPLIDEAVDSYTRMLELGEITPEQFELYLAGAGVDPAIITYLGDTHELRGFLGTVPAG